MKAPACSRCGKADHGQVHVSNLGWFCWECLPHRHGGSVSMRGPTEDPPMVLENQDLKEQNRQLREQLADVLDESHELHMQVERYLNYIAELEAEIAAYKNPDNQPLTQEQLAKMHRSER